MRPGVLIAGIAFISAICFFRSYNELGHLSKLKRALRTGDDAGSNENEEGRLAIPSSHQTGWPDKEICVIWHVDPGFDQYKHAMDRVLADVEDHYFRVIYDDHGLKKEMCKDHTLVVSVCRPESLHDEVYKPAKEQGVRRLGLYCIADESSVLTLDDFEGASYGFHEYGPSAPSEGTDQRVMVVPLGPTAEFGMDLNPRLRWPLPSDSARPTKCAFKGRPNSDERKALLSAPKALHDLCTIKSVTDFKRGLLYRSELLSQAVCLCPKGGSFEQFRLWESLESGCLPVTTNASPMPAILGHTHPLPTMTHGQWLGENNHRFHGLVDAVGFFGSGLKAAVERRREVEAWFTWYKARLRYRAASLVLADTGAVASAAAVPAAHVNPQLRAEPQQMVETVEKRARALAPGSDDWREVRESMLAAIPKGPAASTTCLVYDTRQDLPEYAYIMDVVLGKLEQDTALLTFWSSNFRNDPRAKRCDAIALVFEGRLDAELMAHAAAEAPHRLVLLALRLTHKESWVHAVAQRSLWPRVTGVMADASSLSILRHILAKDPSLQKWAAEGQGLEVDGNLKIMTMRKAQAFKPLSLVLLPWGPRSGFGNSVSIPQAKRPAVTRTHRCIRLKESNDATWGPKLRGRRLSHMEWDQLCPIVDVRQLNQLKGQTEVQPTHLRLLLLDTVYAILPSASERGDTNLLWEALACGAIPVLSGDRNAIADELLKGQGLPPSPIPLLDTEFEATLAQSSQREWGDLGVQIGATQRELFTYSTKVKRWVQDQAAMLLNVDT